MVTTLITALDVDTQEAALAVADRIGAAAEWFKVGKQLFTRCGAEVVRGLKARGKKVFLDLKYHDIPNTVEQAVRAAAAIGADLCNVHASGGPAMLRAAAKAGADTGMQVVAVTVLTSMDQAELNAIGITETPAEAVLRLARLAKDCGLPGVVCSAHEIAPLRKAFGSDFLLVVPGIRPAGASLGDQKRVMTPAEAAQAGAQYIVVGRPILAAADPAKAAKDIQAEIQGR
ncbi:MAG: Orotidine 5'-phosphate decarboxylase [Lentisphaerae bacterium ADurb.Bin082]|nr:MAG: Orotidine 5'-phosphate decarboxylase [Lentisphaerae bacterium ADurb.Bin082]